MNRDSGNARVLAEYFLNGGEPQAINARMRTEPGEFCVGDVPVSVYQEMEGDGAYVHKSGGYFVGGSPAGLVLGGAFSAARFTANVVGNKRRRAKAAQEAAAQWRQVDEGRLFVTNRRFAVQGRTWADLWYQHLRVSDCDGQVIELHLSGQPALKLAMPDPDYWYVMLQKLAFNNVTRP